MAAGWQVSVRHVPEGVRLAYLEWAADYRQAVRVPPVALEARRQTLRHRRASKHVAE